MSFHDSGGCRGVCRTWWRSVCTSQVRRTVSGPSAAVKRGSVAASSASLWRCRRSEWNGLKRTFRSRWKVSTTHFIGSIPHQKCTPRCTVVALLRCVKRPRLRRKSLRPSLRPINEPADFALFFFVICFPHCYSLWMNNVEYCCCYRMKWQIVYTE